MKDLIFISSALQQPRHQKRIKLLEEAFSLSIFYFYRKKYNANMEGLAEKAFLIGRLKDGKYFYRIFLLFKLAWKIWSNSADRVYCTAIDQAALSVLMRKKTYLELGDLYQFSKHGRYLRFLDSFVVPRLSGLILTSPHYFSGYYQTRFPEISNKVLVVENKLPVELMDEVIAYRSNFKFGLRDGRIRVGLIGSFYSERPLRALRDLIATRSDLELHIYGSGLLNIFENLEACYYHGEFENPGDLTKIYQSIDINYVVYDSDDENVKLALPNKLYESLAYCVPLLVATNVALGEVVGALGCGIAVDLNDIEFGVNHLRANYAEYQKKIHAMALNEFIGFDANKVLSLMGE